MPLFHRGPTDGTVPVPWWGCGTHCALWWWPRPRLAAQEGRRGATNPMYRCFTIRNTSSLAHAASQLFFTAQGFICSYKTPTSLIALCARRMHPKVGEKKRVSPKQHTRCFHIKPASAAGRHLLSSIPGSGAELCAAQSCPTVGPDSPRSDVGTRFAFSTSAASVEIEPCNDKS